MSALFRGYDLMEQNLEEQYELIETLIEDYYSFVDRILKRSFSLPMIIKTISLMLSNFIDRKNSFKAKERMLGKQLAEMVCSEDDRKSIYYQIVIDPHVLHKLSCLVEQKYPNIVYEQLYKEHEISHIRNQSALLMKVFGFVLAVGTILLKTVPKEVVDWLNIDYLKYQLISVGMVGVFLAYTTSFIILWYKTKYQRKRVYELTNELIEYTALRLKAQSQQIKT
jgi:hypothetical protein